MKRILLIVAMLLMAAPALAAVTITASQASQGDPVTISYTADANVRAFALDINVGGAMTINDICDFNVGDTNGYGIFPGKFRDYIDAGDTNWADAGYNPVASLSDPDANDTGLGGNYITVELGSLGADLGTIRSGTLFRLVCDCNGGASELLHLTANATRGGVVGEDGSSIGPTLNDCTVVCEQIVCTVPTIIGLTEAAALSAIDACDLVAGVRTDGFSDTVPVGSVMAQAPAGGTVVDCESAVDYQVVCRTINCLNPRCKGDVNGDTWVRNNDILALGVLISSYPSPTYRARNTTCEYHPCADINGDNWVRNNDILALGVQISGYPSPTYRCRCGTTNCPFAP